MNSDQITRIIKKFSKKLEEREYLKICSEVKDILIGILKQHRFVAFKHAKDAVESPNDLIVPWDHIDDKTKEETLKLLEKIKKDALRFSRELDDLLEIYGSFDNLENYLVSLLERNYPYLRVLVSWGD